MSTHCPRPLRLGTPSLSMLYTWYSKHFFQVVPNSFPHSAVDVPRLQVRGLHCEELTLLLQMDRQDTLCFQDGAQGVLAIAAPTSTELEDSVPCAGMMKAQSVRQASDAQERDRTALGQDGAQLRCWSTGQAGSNP